MGQSREFRAKVRCRRQRFAHQKGRSADESPHPAHDAAGRRPRVAPPRASPPRRTTVAIDGDGSSSTASRPTRAAPGTGKKIEGLLLNSRMVQGDLRRPEPRDARPVGLPRHRKVGRRAQHARVRRRDAGVAAARAARRSRSTCRAAARRGTRRTSRGTTPRSSADGALRPEYLGRLERILDRPTSWAWSSSSATSTSARTSGSRTRRRCGAACDNAIDWLLDKGYRNVLIEVEQRVQRPRTTTRS